MPSDIEPGYIEDKLHSPIEKALGFYTSNYEAAGSWFLKAGRRERTLGLTRIRRCRFCRRRSPEVSFRKLAHAIPELLGNKTLFTAYECDSCNGSFGRGIENDLGNWSKPLRTLSLIAGKGGKPALKGRMPDGDWRIDGRSYGLELNQEALDSVVSIDEKEKTMTFRLPRDTYTPRAVFKSFIKIALSLVPEDDVSFFSDVLPWIADNDHRKPWPWSCSVVAQHRPGPAGANGLGAILLRRTDDYRKLPFYFLIISVGSQTFQIPLPTTQKNWALEPHITIPIFPAYSLETAKKWGMPERRFIDLNGADVIRGEIETVTMRFEDHIAKQTEAKQDTGS